METNINYRFRVFIDRSPKMTKHEMHASVGGTVFEEERKRLGISKMQMVKKALTPNELLHCLTHGQSYAHEFTYYGDYLTYKSNENFASATTIAVDIDDTDYSSPQEIISRLRFMPTLWHTTTSHMQYDEEGRYKGVRFRMIYVLDCPISNFLYFRYCADSLFDIIKKDISIDAKGNKQKIAIDECGNRVAQTMFATNVDNADLIVDSGCCNTIYSLEDWGIPSIQSNEFKDYLLDGCGYKTDVNRRDIAYWLKKIFNYEVVLTNNSWQYKLDQKMINDADRLSFEEFKQEYKHYYPIIYRTEKAEWKRTIDNIKYQKCDEHYLELPWIGYREKDSGNMHYYKDGECRRKKIFHRAWLRRAIEPNATPNEILYNLILDRYHFFDNSDGVLSAEWLAHTTLDVFAHDIDYYIEKYDKQYNFAKEKSAKKKFIIHWMSKKYTSNSHVKKMIDWELIDAVYDRRLSALENLEIINDSEIFDPPLSKDSLYRYCTCHDISTNPHPQILFLTFYQWWLTNKEKNLNLKEEHELFFKEKGIDLKKHEHKALRIKVKEFYDYEVYNLHPKRKFYPFLKWYYGDRNYFKLEF